MSYYVQKGEKVLISYYVQKCEKVLVSSKKIKTLLNTKRRISLRGSFIYVSFDHLQKDFENNLQKNLQKQNMWCKRGPKC
jgi:hypothetical protein